MSAHVAGFPVQPADQLEFADSTKARLDRLEHIIRHGAHLLPAQGPITVFIHHNTLHALEDLPFEEAVKQGAKIFGCQPYLTEAQYRQHLVRGRIRLEDLSSVLLDDLGDDADVLIGLFGTRFHLRLAMLQHALQQAPDAELRWFVAETDALARFRGDVPVMAKQRSMEETRHWVMRDLRRNGHSLDRTSPAERRIHDLLRGLIQRFGESSMESWSDATWEAFTLQALWRICREGVHGLKQTHVPQSAPLRHRDLLLQACGEDADRLVNDLLIRFCAAFLDQGFSSWNLPRRKEGFVCAFYSLYRQGCGPPDAWLRGLSAELARLEDEQISPLQSIEQSLLDLGVPESEWDSFLSDTLLALRGWGGMICQMEQRADRAVHAPPQGSLVEFLAIRLLLDRLALAYLAKESMGFTGPLSKLRHEARGRIPHHEPHSVEQRAFLVFQLAQVRGWLPSSLHQLTKQQWSTLVAELERFSALERRRLFHLAFERRYRTQALDALSVHAVAPRGVGPTAEFQVVCCLDEREESFRRHLEEVAPGVETFGVAGFFIVAMYYRGAADAHYMPLCPIVIRPQHWVEEQVVYTFEESHRRRAKTRRALGTASHHVHVGSRTFAGGVLVAAGLGVFASIPLVARVLFPRLTSRIRRLFSRLVQPPPLTQLQLQRSEPQPGPANGQIGFSIEEMTNIAERLLRDIGLTRKFARLVVFLGHGSNSLNNPHNSAYNCGACGGGAGGPNARAAAQILNDVRVRQALVQRGLKVPDDTVFVGGLHNTCNDAVTYYDLDRLPKTHEALFNKVHADIEATCDRNAHERCRRFVSAPLNLSLQAARWHVEERSEDLSQTRPECGHATNAITVVGRRDWTRGLFLDRRAFLTSYDPTQDDEEHTILTRVLLPVFPVCAGINLEYYFSFVDPTGWGCGTKLPHNVTALLGVMDGHASDLRTGLPWQMVEIHEPVRSLFIVETTPEAMLSVIDRNPAIAIMCRNAWVQLAVIDPNSSRIHVYRHQAFEPYEPENVNIPTTPTSLDWYRGWRDHLGFAILQPDKDSQPIARI